MIQATQDIHQCTLARTAGTHQGNHFALLDRHGNALEHRHINFADVIGLDDVFQFDQFHRYTNHRRLNCGVNGLAVPVWSEPPRSSPTITSVPSATPPPEISVMAPSLGPVFTFSGCTFAPSLIHSVP